MTLELAVQWDESSTNHASRQHLYLILKWVTPSEPSVYAPSSMSFRGSLGHNQVLSALILDWKSRHLGLCRSITPWLRSLPRFQFGCYCSSRSLLVDSATVYKLGTSVLVCTYASSIPRLYLGCQPLKASSLDPPVSQPVGGRLASCHV